MGRWAARRPWMPRVSTRACGATRVSAATSSPIATRAGWSTRPTRRRGSRLLTYLHYLLTYLMRISFLLTTQYACETPAFKDLVPKPTPYP
eukprot:scaffold2412_cov39-Phaeocystis_antarctica.AAC.1